MDIRISVSAAMGVNERERILPKLYELKAIHYIYKKDNESVQACVREREREGRTDAKVKKPDIH